MSDNSQMQDALRDVAGSDEALRDRVKLIVMRWLSQHRVDPAALHEVTAAAVDGLGAGFAPRGQAASAALASAVQGIDEAVSRAVYALQMAAEEAWDGGRQFAANDLKASLDELRGLEISFVQSLRDTADKSQGWLRQEFLTLGDHLSRNGSDTGRRVREVTEILGNRLKGAASGAGRDALDSTTLVRSRLAAIASGVLRGIADAIESKP